MVFLLIDIFQGCFSSAWLFETKEQAYHKLVSLKIEARWDRAMLPDLHKSKDDDEEPYEDEDHDWILQELDVESLVETIAREL